MPAELESEAVLERLHVLACIWRKRQRIHARNDEAFGGGDGAKEADHSQTTVVELDEEASGLGLWRVVLLREKAERVVKIERHRMWCRLFERGEVARFATCEERCSQGWVRHREGGNEVRQQRHVRGVSKQ